ncbi:MAG TPA: catechol 1,2-dioxygenase [Acidimicrobiaceae bacterium]|nr:catechol 1,2-dioxygenase [Acidimicrobiaceae bacterium]
MGEIVGSAVVAHVPPLVLPEEVRLELNSGTDFSIVEGLHRMRRECIDPLQPDTIVVLDTHWFTTFEWVVSAHERRAGKFTSEELPRGNPQMPYDMPGDPELAHLIAEVAAERSDTWFHASDDPYLPVRYATVYLTPFLQRDEKWISFSTCQTAEFNDMVIAGEVLGEAIRRSNRRVVLVASGALSHKFWPLSQLRQHEGADPADVFSPEHRAADERVIKWMEAGDHAAILADYPDFKQYAPEGRFAHYVIMATANGGAAWKSQGVPYSDYENAAGTGQIHMWFPAGA